MNLRKWIIGSCLLMVFASCNKESQDVLDEHIDVPKTKEIMINLTAGKEGSDDLRAVYGVDVSDDMGRLLNLEMPEKDVVLRVGVRRGDGLPIIQDIVFTKTPGRNHATYSGKITVPTDGTGNYKIAALLKEEVGGEKFLLSEDNAANPQLTTPGRYSDNDASLIRTRDRDFGSLPGFRRKSDADKLTINVPYISSWQDLSVDGDVAQPIKLQLQPQGTVLRVRIHNKTEVAKTFHRVKFVTNAFVYTGNFRINEVRDNYPAWYTGNQETFEYIIPDGTQVQPGRYSEWLYLWVMPRKLTIRERTTVAGVTVDQNPTASNSYVQAFSTSQSLPMGSVPVTLVYNEGHEATFDPLVEVGEEWGQAVAIPKLSLEYLAEYPLNLDGTAFVDNYNYENPNVGFYGYYDVQKLLKSPIAGVKWRVPNRNEWASIFVPEIDASGYGSYKMRANSETYGVREENIKIGNVTQSYEADYKVMGNVSRIYAVRFKNQSNKWRTAFRYWRTGSTATKDLRLVIEATYLGPENLVLSDVAQDSFWNTRASENKVIRREFPFYGANNLFAGHHLAGQQGFFGSIDRYDETAWYVASILGSYPRLGGLSIASSYPVYAIRSF